MPHETPPWPVPPPQARRVADVVRDACAVADWNLARELYRQIIAMLPEQAPDELFGAFAEAMVDLAAAYAGRIELLGSHLLAVMAAVEGVELLDDALFHRLFHDERFIRTGGDGRRPPPLQSVVETCRRLRDLELLSDLLCGTRSSGVLCGSVSYGAHYNVRAASDLDLLVVVDVSGTLATIGDRIARLPGIDGAEVAQFAARARIFAGRYDDGNTAFSHKLTRHGAYRLSLHVVTRPLLRYILVTPAIHLTTGDGRIRTMRDYRATGTTRRDVHRSFAGRQHVSDPVIEPADGGQLRTTSIYRYDETDAYCLGFVQSLLLTADRRLPWDDLGVGAELASFDRKLRERLRSERAAHPYTIRDLSLAHVRRAVLGPHVLKALR
jgi:hypothetical protein